MRFKPLPVFLLAASAFAQDSSSLLEQLASLLATVTVLVPSTSPIPSYSTPTVAWTPSTNSADAIPSSLFNGLNSALKSVTFRLPTQTSRIQNYDPPPSSIINMILTAIPGSVIGELINPTERSSLASQFKAGNTPAWYQNLPEPVKSYVTNVLQQMSAGGGSMGLNGALATKSDHSTSKGLAARPTGDIAASIAGAIGLFGAIIAL